MRRFYFSNISGDENRKIQFVLCKLQGVLQLTLKGMVFTASFVEISYVCCINKVENYGQLGISMSVR